MPDELQRELRSIRHALEAMAHASEARVATCLEAWLNADTDLACSICNADDEIDRMDVDIEERCIRLIACHQPVATDLRHVIATLRIITSLERTADLARSISKRVIKLNAAATFAQPPDVVVTMGAGVTEMLEATTRALDTEDIELARTVRRKDRFVDQCNRDIFAWAIEQSESDPSKVEGHFGTIVMARNLERIGDMAANIAEDVIFAIGGSVVRHAPI